jgi:hypothetical protein
MPVTRPSTPPPAETEPTSPLIEEDPNHADCLDSSFRSIIVDHHSPPVEDSGPPIHPSHRGKLRLSELFEFGNSHWSTLYKKYAKRCFNEELAVYDLLNEDAAAGNGTEVDVDETTAEILIC